MKRTLPILPIVLALAGCAMPQTTVRTTDTRPSLVVTGAPAGALLYVDGEAAGPTDDGAGPVAVRVEPGTHQVEVRDSAGALIYQQKVFVESELKTIQVH
jgi:hypothetical protein